MAPELTKTRIAVAIGVAVVVLVSVTGAYLAANPQLVDYGEEVLFSPNHPKGDIPAQLDGSGLGTVSACVDFERPRADNQVFDFQSHDAMVVEENGSYYAVVGTDSNQRLYRSETPTDSNSWRLLYGDYLADSYEFDSMIRVDDRYLAYGNSDVYTTEALPTDDWVKGNDNTGFRDLGAWYDESTGLVHVYYEWGYAAGHSGKKIGHAVSPNGVRNWTVYPTVWTAPKGLGVGDFEVVERDGLLFILGDYDPYHPKYNVSVWVNDDPYTEFTKLDDPAVAPLPDGPANDDFGVGDPSIVPLEDGRFLMLANGHANRSAPAKLHYYVGRIQADWRAWSEGTC